MRNEEIRQLQPELVFYYFEKICSIPHTSFHEKELSDFCVQFAQERGLFYQQDEMGNVIIIKDAAPGYESQEALMLQGHLDMVGAKTQECSIDLERDGLTLVVEGDFIRADSTTLGADDGIAVAYALAILDAKDLPHPRLEVILTVSEEVGLLGASAIDLSVCKAMRLINLDSEEEGIITAGCAGGRRACIRVPVRRKSSEGILVQLQLEGLRGGHSGTEIHKGRANANVLLGRFLYLLWKKIPFGLCRLCGGVKENVIPDAAQCEILIQESETMLLDKVIEEFQSQMRQEYGSADPDICLSWKNREDAMQRRQEEVLQTSSALAVMQLLYLHPNGVQAMCADLEGLVETSLNLGLAELTADALILRCSIRSSVASAKQYLWDKLVLLTSMAGGEITYSGDYPAWPYARDSKLRNLCVRVFEAQYGRKPQVTVIHAGLECGILAAKKEGLDCVSIGPNLFDIHSPKERVSISSVQRVWEYLKAILAVKE